MSALRQWVFEALATVVALLLLMVVLSSPGTVALQLWPLPWRLEMPIAWAGLLFIAGGFFIALCFWLRGETNKSYKPDPTKPDSALKRLP